MNIAQSPQNHKTSVYTLKETAELLEVTKSAIIHAIRENKLNATKQEGHWIITRRDIKKYYRSRWSRAKSTYLGELLYDKEKGEYSVREAAKVLNCDPQHIYYALRKNKIKSERKNHAWVINIKDIMEYQLPKPKKKKKKILRMI